MELFVSTLGDILWPGVRGTVHVSLKWLGRCAARFFQLISGVELSSQSSYARYTAGYTIAHPLSRNSI